MLLKLNKRLLLLLLVFWATMGTVRAETVVQSDIEKVYEQIRSLYPETEIELQENEEFEDGMVIFFKKEIQDLEYQVWFCYEKTGELKCVFYVNPDDFHVSGESRDDALSFLNQINSEMSYPAVYLSGTNYQFPAGFDILMLPSYQEDMVESFLRRTVDGIDAVMDILSKSGLFNEENDDAVNEIKDFVAEPTSASATPTPVPVNPDTNIEYVYEKQVCPYCHGTGMCPLCDGTGVYRLYGVSVECEKECTYCNGNKYVEVLKPQIVGSTP